MIRKAFVDWQKFGPETRLQNKKEYMICLPMEDGTAVLNYATYYDKGTLVEVPMADGAEPAGKEPTAEEQLLKTIFGACRTYVIPKDGFYVVTADYGVDEETEYGAFAGCSKMAACLGDREDEFPIYWAETPLLPEEVLSGHADAGDSVKEQQKKLQEKYETLYERVCMDPVTKQVYECFCKKALPADPGVVDYQIGQAVYGMPHRMAAELVCDAWDMCKALAKIPEDAFLSMSEQIKDCTAKEAAGAMSEFCAGQSLPEKPRTLVLSYAEYLSGSSADFYYYRNSRLFLGGVHSLNMPAVLQEAWALSTLPFRAGRLVKLISMGAPEIILVNELRVLVERLFASRQGSRIVCVGPDFDAMYGVQPDGSRGMRHCEFGDSELYMMEPEPDPAEEEMETGDAVEMDLPGEPEEEPQEAESEPVLGVDYPWFAVVPAPNFLMRKCRFVLWDNAAKEYFRDEDGVIEQFTEWNAAKTYADALSAGL